MPLNSPTRKGKSEPARSQRDHRGRAAHRNRRLGGPAFPYFHTRTCRTSRFPHIESSLSVPRTPELRREGTRDLARTTHPRRPWSHGGHVHRMGLGSDWGLCAGRPAFQGGDTASPLCAVPRDPPHSNPQEPTRQMRRLTSKDPPDTAMTGAQTLPGPVPTCPRTGGRGPERAQGCTPRTRGHPRDHTSCCCTTEDTENGCSL